MTYLLLVLAAGAFYGWLICLMRIGVRADERMQRAVRRSLLPCRYTGSSLGR